MKFSVVVCTYMRPNDILKMLESIKNQTLYPDQIIIVDASLNFETKEAIEKNKIVNLEYFFVNEDSRGSARQRNYGINRVGENIDIVCFLDDDVILTENYFEELIKTYSIFPNALGVGGYVVNDPVIWKKLEGDCEAKFSKYYFDGWKIKENSRNLLRKALGLASDVPPAFMPSFSHGRSSLPPSGKIYLGEQLIGCTCSFKKVELLSQKFDDYFTGYSLYEDTALSLKISKKGNLYINTNAKLYHYHSPSGRPNQYKYGKMVVRNGWYVWRVKNPKPSFKDQFKWHSITILLTIIRFSNTFTSNKRAAAFTEAVGRSLGWWSLLISKPRNKS
jgi:GT2 family glycosyltransferase